MAVVRAKIFDRNRYGKKYPLVRAPKKNVYLGDSEMTIEIQSVAFSNEETKAVTFESPYPDTNFRILLSPRETTDSDSANVILTVINSETSVNGFTIASSASFTGTVDVVVLRIV